MNRRTPFTTLDTHEQVRELRNRLTVDVLELADVHAIADEHDDVTSDDLRLVASVVDLWEFAVADPLAQSWSVRLRVRPDATITPVLQAARVAAKIVRLDSTSLALGADTNERVWLTMRSPTSLQAVANVTFDEDAIARCTTLPALDEVDDAVDAWPRVIASLRTLGANQHADALERLGCGAAAARHVAGAWSIANTKPQAVAGWLDAYADLLAEQAQ